MLMSQQIKEKVQLKLKYDMNKLIFKNKEALKTYWPLLFLALFPTVIVYVLLINQKPSIQVPTKVDQKAIELHRQQNAHIKNVEQRLNELNQHFLALQNQHTKIVKSLISLKATTIQQKQENGLPTVNIVKKNTLEILDRIGEKIRLNEPFSGLLTNLPKECMGFPGYKTLHHFSARLPLTFVQLKKSFDDIQKNHTTAKTDLNLPKWAIKIASIFQGNIRVEKSNQTDKNLFQPVTEALEIQDLKLAYSFAKDLQIPAVKSWVKLAIERISLEEEYHLFAENVQHWTQQTSLSNNPATITTQENQP